MPRELEWDEWDERSDHALALDASGSAVGTARLLPDGHIGRVAVLGSWRRQGIGGMLLQAILGQARLRGFREVKLHAQVHAAGFYLRHGFTPGGTEFMEAGIAHLLMSRELD